jgi:[ribosomal protein S5]-alanine N-acetyltransferase
MLMFGIWSFRTNIDFRVGDLMNVRHAQLIRVMDPEIVGEDFLDFKCPHCGALNSFPTSAAGLARECVNCLELVLVPTKDGEPGRKLPLPIETPKIRLRKFQAPDWTDLLEFEFEDEDEATGWIHKVCSVRSGERLEPMYLAMEARDSRKVVGTLGFRFVDASFEQVELSFSSNPAAMPAGLELEALDAALYFCFQDLKVHRVTMQCAAQDSERRKLLTELGMRQEGEFLKHHRVGAEWISTVWFAMLEEEYFKDQSADGKPS